MQITYFPYINLKKRPEVNFGNIKIWNFDLKASDEIKDKNLLDIVTKLIKSNVSKGNPIKGIGVVSIGDTDFRIFNDNEKEMIQETQLLLFLSFISKNNVNATGQNAGHYVATSENFTIVTQNFEPSSNFIAEQSGWLVRRLNGGYRIGELLFHMPPYVPEPLGFDLDEELICELQKLAHKNVSTYLRILRAADLLSESLFNDPFVSVNARILLQVCSFEILLKLPDKNQRQYFKEEIKKLIVGKNEKEITYYSERINKKAKEKASLKVIWADKLYTLRNHIIHGSKVKENEFYFRNQQHFVDISPLFFILIVKEIINIKKGTKKKYFSDDIKWNKYEDSNGNTRYGFVYDDSRVRRYLAQAISQAYKKLKKK
jgi:hypothetical protein